MMINCPNCNLLQPKDQYCAQCGVNMNTWTPPQPPWWKQLLSNWMVQLGLLFLIILLVVMFDSLSNSSKEKRPEPPPVSSEIDRAESFARQKSNKAVAKFNEQEVTETTGAPSQTENPEDNNETKKTKLGLLQKRVSMKLMTVVPSAIDSISQLGRVIEDGAFVVKRQSQWLSKNRKGITGYGSTVRNNYEFNQPFELFFGERDLETGRRIGFFVQVIVSDTSSATELNIELRFWHQLKLDAGPSAPIAIEARLQKQDRILIVDPSVHDLGFTPEETSLFESSSRLNGLNSELFVDSLSDIAVLVEFK